MPPLKGAPAARNVCANVTNAVLILIVIFFVLGTIWLQVFAIPAFFVLFRAAVVTIASVRQGVNNIQAVLEVMRPLSFQSLRLGAACGLAVTILAGVVTAFGLAILRTYVLSGDSLDFYVGIFQIVGAVLFTHMGVSVLQQGSCTSRSMRYYQRKLEGNREAAVHGPERSQMFYLGLGASLREGMESYIYMIPLGAAYESDSIPIPAVLGLIAGLLAARYLVPVMVWGGIDEGATIRPDSHAKSWAVRREKLTDQYVSRLAAQAQGRTVTDADDVHASTGRTSAALGAAAGGNMSELSAEALQGLFKDSNIDPDDFNDMNYAQKRLLLLKSTKALVTSNSLDDDSDGGEPGIVALQNSSQLGSVSDHDYATVGGSGMGHQRSGSRNTFHRRGESIVSVTEDEDGYINRGGYSHDYADYPPSSTAHSAGHVRTRSIMRRAGSHRSRVSMSSVRFQDSYDDDDTRSVMTGFEHRHLSRAGTRHTKAELEAMEDTLERSVMATKLRRDRGRGTSFRRLAPGSPNSLAPHAPSQGVGVYASRYSHQNDEELGGNMALGSSKKRQSMRSRRQPSKQRGSGEVADIEEGSDDNVDGGRMFMNMEEMEEKSIFTSFCLGISAFVVFLCCAGLFKMGVAEIRGVLSDSEESSIFDICSCCTADEEGSVAEQFFAIFSTQFGYTCSETLTGILSWACFWIYPILVMMFTMRILCFSCIPTSDLPQMAVAPTRKRVAALAATGFKSTRRFAQGHAPDPARIGRHPTHGWIKISAMLNVVSGTAYIWWRAARSMPDDPVSPIWNWLFFAGECILVVGVWTSHLQRAFPAIREVCTMDDLVEIDSSVANEATVCIMVPTAGEKMKNVKHVLLGAYSQRLWPSTVHANRQLRIAVLDEKGRHEVRDLVEKVYRLAEVLVKPSVQLELCTKFDEPFITPKIFMDYFNQMDALDKFVFGKETHPAFDIALRIENYTGVPTNKLARASSSSGAKGGAAGGKKSKAKGPTERLDEGFKQLFNSSSNIPSMIYSARANPGTPKVSPKAGNMNAAIFPNSPGEEPVIGDAARIVVVNDARHRLKTEFLQRTVPYFFKLNKETRKNYSWTNVGFVQTPQRFEDLGDSDPLGNHAVLTFFVSNVSKDGVGGVTSCGQGSLWRVDALRGMAADGRQTVDSVATPDIIGHDCGFRSEVLIEDTHTSLEFFKLQWRSAYVCEPGETLAVCVEQPNTVAWRVKQVFRWHIGAVQLLLKDGIAFMCTSKMPTILHKMFGLDSLTYYIQAVGGFFILLMPIMFSIFQETPFTTRDLEFIYFFFPFIITATIPTLLAIGWKNVNPNRVLTDEQFWLATCYVQIWAFALGVWNRITCANPDNAWNLVCPVWPLGFLFYALLISAVNTTAHWAYTGFDSDDQWIFLASFGACIVVMYSIWPMFKLWWPGWVALPSAYHQKFIYILIFIAVSSVLATYL